MLKLHLYQHIFTKLQVVGAKDEVISNENLKMLLDRSDLYRIWENQKLAATEGSHDISYKITNFSIESMGLIIKL